MNLILREMTQDTLDSLGLTNFFIGLSDKDVVLKSDCGKIMLHIKGVCLSKAAPSKKELDIAADLIDIFMRNNADTIHDFLRTKSEYLHAMQVRDLAKDKLGAHSVEFDDDGNVTVVYSEGLFHITLHSNGEIVRISPHYTRRPVEPISIKDLSSFIRKHVKDKKVTELEKASKAAAAAREDMEAAKQKMDTCTI